MQFFCSCRNDRVFTLPNCWVPANATESPKSRALRHVFAELVPTAFNDLHSRNQRQEHAGKEERGEDRVFTHKPSHENAQFKVKENQAKKKTNKRTPIHKATTRSRSKRETYTRYQNENKGVTIFHTRNLKPAHLKSNTHKNFGGGTAHPPLCSNCYAESIREKARQFLCFPSFTPYTTSKQNNFSFPVVDA